MMSTWMAKRKYIETIILVLHVTLIVSFQRYVLIKTEIKKLSAPFSREMWLRKLFTDILVQYTDKCRNLVTH